MGRAFLKKLNFETLLKLITFSQDKLDSFPIVYFSILRKAIYVPPYTISLIHKYLSAKYTLDIGIENSKLGPDFEKEIASILNEIGISTNQPNSDKIQLINVKDNEDNPSLEIDVVGYTKDTIWIIDCKHFIPNTSFFTNNRRQKIFNKLRNERIKEKQILRANFVKNNLEKFGFSSSYIKHYKSAVITLLEEPLEKVGTTYLVSKSKLNDLFSIPDLNFEE